MATQENRMITIFNLYGYFYFKENENKKFFPNIIVDMNARNMLDLFEIKKHLNVGDIIFNNKRLKCQFIVNKPSDCKIVTDYLSGKLLGARKNNFEKFKENIEFVLEGEHTEEEITSKLSEKKDFERISEEEENRFKDLKTQFFDEEREKQEQDYELEFKKFLSLYKF